MPGVYERLGLVPAINARGSYSDLGGSRLAASVWQAMQESNDAFIEIEDLLQKTGDAIARLLDVESARVTSGVSAGLALSAAACMTKGDGRAIEGLPDTAGLPYEGLIQHGHRYRYDRCFRLSGMRLIEVGGSDREITPAIFAAAITTETAAVIFPAHLDGVTGTLGMEDVAAIAHGKGIPVVVDAAYQVDPPQRMRSWYTRGGDIVCISAKYMEGPNSGGFVFGRQQLIDWIARCDFTGFESSDYLTFGRAFKLDRQIIVGVTEALQEWMARDHQARHKTYSHQISELSSMFADTPEIKLVPRFFTMEETLEDGPTNCLQIMLPKRIDAQSLARRLSRHPPRILLHVFGNSLAVAMEVLRPGEEIIVGERILKELASYIGELQRA